MTGEYEAALLAAVDGWGKKTLRREYKILVRRLAATAKQLADEQKPADVRELQACKEALIRALQRTTRYRRAYADLWGIHAKTFPADHIPGIPGTPPHDL